LHDESLSPTGGPWLRILATSDLHMHVLPYDYVTATRRPGIGLSAAARTIAALRQQAEATLLFDNGDFLQGSPLGDTAARLFRRRGAGTPHPMLVAMNRLGYDAVALGNHEFNYGLDFLADALSAAAFPVLAANLRTARGTRLPVVPAMLFRRSLRDAGGRPVPLTVGAFGLVPPQIAGWDRHHLEGRLACRDMVETARIAVPRLRQAGAEVVVALAHTGLEPTGAPGEGDAAALARLPGIDAIVAGHSHLVFPSDRFAALDGADIRAGALHGVPCVMPGHAGSHVGVIDLSLRHDAAGGWRVDGGRARAVPVALHRRHDGPEGGAAAAAIAAAVRPAHRRTVAALARTVGATAEPLCSHFALVTPSGTQRLVAAAKRHAIAPRLAGTGWESLPLLAAAALFGGGPSQGIDIAAGPVLARHLAGLSPFPNTVAALCLTGAALVDWLERAAGVYATLRPGAQDQPLLSGTQPLHAFDLVDRLRYAVDLAQPPRFDAAGRLRAEPGRRIRDVMLAGRPVRPRDRFVVVTNSFRAQGGGGFPVAGAGPPLLTDLPVSAAIAEYLATAGPFVPDPAPVWRFAAIPGATALLPTAPAAAGHPLPPGTSWAAAGPDGNPRLRLAF
jgi:2',3'-cyclic-nucleotide 2'-phosphodiesterase/3'-nucleotidase